MQAPVKPAFLAPVEPGFLVDLYECYNNPSWIYPDPLAIVREYQQPEDIETAGLICAALALGTVKAIMTACRTVLSVLGPSPAFGLSGLSDSQLSERLTGFRYRFFGAEDLSAFLAGARKLRQSFGSLEDAFLSVINPKEPDYADAASRFVGLLATASPAPWKSNLFPDPQRGSAAKRVVLYLGLMILKDPVDPGPWS